MKPKLHDEHNTKVLNEDRLSITGFSLAPGASTVRHTAVTDSCLYLKCWEFVGHRFLSLFPF